MPNITMTLDGDVLKKARKRAIEKNTTLTALMRQYMERLAEEEDLRRDAIVAELMEAFDSEQVVVGPKRWTRDELHER